MRPATPADRPAVEAFCRAHIERAMFPLSNLARFGWEGSAPYAPRFWLAERAGEVTDVLARCTNGATMPLLPSGNFAAAAACLAGGPVSAVLGPADWARGLIAALPLAGARPTLDRDEPHYALDLARLHLPEGAGELVPLSRVPLDLLTEWRDLYDREALGAEGSDGKARAEIEGYIAADSHRALVVDGVPVAMTGFNAWTPDAVQVGGVYTPVPLRRRGHAGRAVALHLAEARARGVRRAILFSASAGAARVYERLGFRRIGDWTLYLLREAVDV